MNITKHLFSWLTGQNFTMYLGGGGGGGGPNTTYSQTSNIPEYAQPYVEKMLGSAQEEIFSTDPVTGKERITPYTPFSNDPSKYFAGPSKLQTDARTAAGNMGVTAETGQAANMARQAGMAGLDTTYQAGQFGNQFQAPGQYQPGQFSMGEARAPDLQNYQFQNAPQDVQSQQFNQQAAQAYMNPYMQSVVDLQQQDVTLKLWEQALLVVLAKQLWMLKQQKTLLLKKVLFKLQVYKALTAKPNNSLMPIKRSVCKRRLLIKVWVTT